MSPDLILESLECAVVIIDEKGVVQTVNLATETLFCQSRRYLIGQNFDELLPDSYVRDCIKDCLWNNSKFTLREIPIEIIGGEILVDVTISCISSKRGVEPSVLIEINSINRISRFMKEKNQVERQQFFRMMMRGLAHEIKNPLGGIRGAAQLLHREIVDPSRQELTEILIKEADRLTRLVDRVMGSREQLKPSLLNIHEVLEHVVHLISVKSKETILVDRFYDPALPEILVDKEQLIQAVLNIVVNAVEAQKQMEQIRIGFVTQFERLVTINRKMHRQVMNIRIWDDGPGVSEDLKEVIFDPLITGRPDGTGLGLSITQEIIQRHQGAVKLEDLNGKTCFSIYLPYSEETVPVSPETS
ncbi:MAG: PAS domain-containing protein [Acidiferrobacterales bacterium]|nr:PAS domain-containing protein [Acidiferrobacterales bacterium]